MRPGMTAHAVLGGTGRPVVGKVIAPAEIAARIDWKQGINSLIRKEPPLHAGLKPEARSAPRSQGVVLGTDGSFRIEDVNAGTYELVIVIDEPVRNPPEPSHSHADRIGPTGVDRAGDARRSIGDEPLDLAAIPSVPIEKK